jgi:hypothetical protein
MPYVACPGCTLRTYSAAAWAETDDCPRCGRELPSRSVRVAPVRVASHMTRAAQIESARIALLRIREQTSAR